MSAPEGSELPPHVERHESGGMVCKHCGGEVSGDGYSTQLPGETGESDSGQMESAEKLSDFGEALKRKYDGGHV